LPGSVPHNPKDPEDGTDRRKPSPNSSNASRQDTVAQGLSCSGSQTKATSPADVLEAPPTEHGGLATNVVDGNSHGREKVEKEDDAISNGDKKVANEDGGGLPARVQEPEGDRQPQEDTERDGQPSRKALPRRDSAPGDLQNGEATAMHEQTRLARVMALGKSEKTLHSQSMRFKALLETQDNIPYGLFSCAHSLEVRVEANDFDLTWRFHSPA
jgi:hypothetical protein